MEINNFAIDEENNPELKAVRDETNSAIAEIDSRYSSAIEDTEQTFDKMAGQYEIDPDDGIQTGVENIIDAQNAATDFTVSKIEQQKEQEKKDYEKEQAGAYSDFKKQTDPFGVNAEKMATNGLTQSGYAESVRAQMYSDYQARIVSAREIYKKAELELNNAITQARLQNDATIAQIALDAFEKQSQIIIQGLTVKNGLLSQWASEKLATQQFYDKKYQNTLAQINYENEKAEEQKNTAWEQDFKTKTFEAETLDKKRSSVFEAVSIGRNPDTYSDEELAALGLTRADLMPYYNAYTRDLEISEEARQREREKHSLEQQRTQLEIDSLQNEVKLVDDDDDDEEEVFPVIKPADEEKVTSGFTGSTYKEAVAYLKSNRVSGATASNILTANEWSRSKRAYSTTGIGGAAVKNYNSYKDYLYAQVEFLILQAEEEENETNEKKETDYMSAKNINRWGAMK